jgi:hypothetical protein
LAEGKYGLSNEGVLVVHRPCHVLHLGEFSYRPWPNASGGGDPEEIPWDYLTAKLISLSLPNCMRA